MDHRHGGRLQDKCKKKQLFISFFLKHYLFYNLCCSLKVYTKWLFLIYKS